MNRKLAFAAMAATITLCGAATVQAASVTTTTTTKETVSAPVVATGVAPGTPGSQTAYYYTSYDKNHDGVIQPEEFNTYVYTRWDHDGDGFLSDEEWQLATKHWYTPSTVEYKTYTYWDKDNDKRLDPSEVQTLVSETSLYSLWDVNHNGTLENDEYASATFNMYDDNHDGTISLTEWKDMAM
jgi:Ca2+-binding EF-hand superfamily protein